MKAEQMNTHETQLCYAGAIDMVIGYHIRNRENVDLPISDLLWSGLALILGMYHKPLKAILVAWILYPVNA